MSAVGAPSELSARSARLLMLLLQAALGLPPWFTPCAEVACLRVLPPRDVGVLLCTAWDVVVAQAAEAQIAPIAERGGAARP